MATQNHCPTCGQRTVNTADANDNRAEDWFELFWAHYPKGRKQAKATAKRVFVQIVSGKHKHLSASPERIVKGAMRYSAAMGDNNTFVKQPAGWLRNGMWEDEDVGTQHLSQQRLNSLDAEYLNVLSGMGVVGAAS